MQKTRYPELLLDHVAGAGWRFADASTRGHVGEYYASKAEALADLDRYYRDSWAGAEARPAPAGYTVRDRYICGPSGVKLAKLDRVEIPEDEHPDRARGCYTTLPTEFDRFARQIAEALNADPKRPDLRPEPLNPGTLDSYYQDCLAEIGGADADPVAALIAAALDLNGYKFASQAAGAFEAWRKLGRALVVLNGAPLGFRGKLNADGPAYPPDDERARAEGFKPGGEG